jgi:cytochrome c5
MSTETFFYIAGGLLVLAAFGISFVGVRSDSFPTRNALRLGVPLFALLVAVVLVGAVRAAEDEQQTRENEEAAVAEEAATAEGDASQNSEGEGQAVQPGATDNAQGEPKAGGGGAPQDTSAGQQVFVDNGCGGCHTLQVLGSQAAGQIGPNLDEALVDKDTKFIETSIVDPSAYVEKGFPDGTMPPNYGTDLSPDEIQALVDFLAQSTSGSTSK